tara:strand:- start:724 stop:1614 length:891 start_codon:yes stop_codon:yes gene_type:complete
MYNKAWKIINILSFLPLIYLFTFELLIRILNFLFTFNAGIMGYSFNNNINLKLHSVKKREFYISDNFKVLKNADINKFKTNQQIWIFRGFTSNKGFCDSKNLAWVDFLKIKLNKINFSKNGINSTFCKNLLTHQLQKKERPKIIIWANKVYEILHSKRASEPNNKFTYFINSLKLILKQNLLIFHFFDEFLLRIFDKFSINIRDEKKNLSNDDYLKSTENFYKNSKLAIELAKLYEADKFYIVSVFNRTNLKNLDTKFFDYYLEKVNKLVELDDFVSFINTKEYLKSDEKKTRSIL